jgi:hypothetical protein
MESYLPVIWAAIIGLAVAMYVILDGFDLGIGILFPFAETDHERDQMMNSVAPFWDGNETWLVLGGAGMMVAFPLAYSIILPALYLPVIFMLLALIFRGVAFEFRWIGVTSKRHWSFAFVAGSTLAAFCQGLILGGLIQGIKVENGAFAGSAFDWATPFATVRPGTGGWLRSAGRHVVDHEDRGQRRHSCKNRGQTAAAGGAGLHGNREHLDAVRFRAHRGEMVLAAEYSVLLVGAGRDVARRIRGMALARDRT